MSAAPGDGSEAALTVNPGEGGGTAALLAPPGECPNTYTATRFEYAKNGETVTYVMGEQWCWDGSTACETGGTYAKTYLREFRYDGDDIYGDFEMVGGSPVNKRSFEPGLGRTANPLTAPVTDYYHGDMLGTTRLMSNPSGASIEPAIYTAFGERISGPTVTDSTRYGYVGAWGYQSTPIPESLTPDPFPYLHLGARYYDPSSGRFLQRDPIGIAGGPNVYAYVNGSPSAYIDPLGLSDRPPSSWPSPPGQGNDWEWVPNKKDPNNPEADPGHWKDEKGNRWRWHDKPPLHDRPPHRDKMPPRGKKGPHERYDRYGNRLLC